tara:strand:+ start:451 stop:654 length:204 start_codon:yes stop_codon:yes gene_type:complete
MIKRNVQTQLAVVDSYKLYKKSKKKYLQQLIETISKTSIVYNPELHTIDCYLDKNGMPVIIIKLRGY